MPHTPYPTLCNIWSLQATLAVGAAPVGAAAHINVPCFLQPIRSMGVHSNTLIPSTEVRFIYSAALTDFQMNLGGGNSAYVELPAGTGKYYRVVDVEDFGKGTTFEERRAMVVPQLFPVPIP